MINCITSYTVIDRVYAEERCDKNEYKDYIDGTIKINQENGLCKPCPNCNSMVKKVKDFVTTPVVE